MATPPFNLDTTDPADTAFQSPYPANQRAFRDNVASYLNTEHDIQSGHHMIPNLTSAQRDAQTNWPNGAIIYNTTSNFLQINIGTALAPNWVAAYYAAGENFQQFTSAGNFTFTIPRPLVTAYIIGSGGGGGGGTQDGTNPTGGSGGGSGAFHIYTLTNLTVGNTLSVTVGAIGGGGAAGGNGSSGGSSSISSGTQIITTATAGGGGGGVAGKPGPNAGGTAGASSGGIGFDISNNGQIGMPGYSTAAQGIIGAGGITSTGMGNWGYGGVGGAATTASQSAGVAGNIGAVFFFWIA